MYYFASDIHLGAGDAATARAVERRFVAWLDDAARDAEAIFLVGDIFDFWFEYRRVVPKGFVRTLGKLAELTDRGVRVVFFTAFSTASLTVDFLAVFFAGLSALSSAALRVRFVGTSKYRVLMGGRVMVMLCSKPCSGFFLVRTALLWTAPEPPNSASSLFRISL